MESPENRKLGTALSRTKFGFSMLTWLTMKKMIVIAAQARVMSIKNLNLKISPYVETEDTGHRNRTDKNPVSIFSFYKMGVGKK